MRPVSKGASPVKGKFKKYQDAKPDLVDRLGSYCSYCERKIATLLAVEHIDPKSLTPGLEKKWSNFLLACTNCNSCKGDGPVDLQKLLLPDRDNTFEAYIYNDDGTIEPSAQLTKGQRTLALETLNLVGLNKPPEKFLTTNGKAISLDRSGQRMEAILKAQNALNNFNMCPVEPMKDMIVNLALETGFFSIWMRIFDTVPEMKVRFIEAFNGTLRSGCFDIVNGSVVCPAPNPDSLNHGGKV
ncbi:TPA: HNH endonuclease [Vibrio vulnificus]|nr:HNH endonuclease [Vibrio vulnificus]HAS6026228.1 HNH endonuclease [Vibrio vulnificus]HAS6036097.1 HNH endonuclease [Vibrio vulnificus]HAT8487515.1 HNH endonuclease [Vibrio vulnificus]